MYGEFFLGGGGEGSPRAPSPIYRENEPPFRRKRLNIKGGGTFRVSEPRFKFLHPATCKFSRTTQGAWPFRGASSENGHASVLGGPLNRLKAIIILSLLRSTAIGTPSAIGRPYLALSRIQMQVGVLKLLVLNRLGSSTAR